MLRKWRQTKLLRKKTLELGKNTKIVNKFISNTDTLHEQTNLDGLEDIIELFDSRNLSQNTLSNLKNSVEEKLNEAKDLLIGLDLGNLPKNGKRQSVWLRASFFFMIYKIGSIWWNVVIFMQYSGVPRCKTNLEYCCSESSSDAKFCSWLRTIELKACRKQKHIFASNECSVNNCVDESCLQWISRKV